MAAAAEDPEQPAPPGRLLGGCGGRHRGDVRDDLRELVARARLEGPVRPLGELLEGQAPLARRVSQRGQGLLALGVGGEQR